MSDDIKSTETPAWDNEDEHTGLQSWGHSLHQQAGHLVQYDSIEIISTPWIWYSVSQTSPVSPAYPSTLQEDRNEIRDPSMQVFVGRLLRASSVLRKCASHVTVNDYTWRCYFEGGLKLIQSIVLLSCQWIITETWSVADTGEYN